MASTQPLQTVHFNDVKDKIDGEEPLVGALFLFFLFFSTLLFVYFIYLCTLRRRGVNPNAPSAGLDHEALGGLPMFAYGSSCSKKPSRGGAECAICLSVFQEGDSVKVLPLCHHGFHSDCVDKWLKTRSSCPLCRHCVNPLSHDFDSDVP